MGPLGRWSDSPWRWEEKSDPHCPYKVLLQGPGPVTLVYNSSRLSLKGLLLPILLVTVCLQSRSPCTMCFFVLIQTFSSHLTGTSRNFWIFTMMYLYLASSSISTGCLLPHHFRMPWNQVLDSARSLQLFLTHVPEVALKPRYFKGIWYLSECFHPPLYNVTPAICSQRSTQKRK